MLRVKIIRYVNSIQVRAEDDDIHALSLSLDLSLSCYEPKSISMTFCYHWNVVVLYVLVQTGSHQFLNKCCIGAWKCNFPTLLEN